ncbi:MAG TPA: MiaB/RimO family radical SAM methylthiotransferase [Terriglobales bacterium]|nr:MiaB/RimO family radical SAM methylthiotransferase [Terriglobales bacterium]
MATFHVNNFGCRANQAEGAALAAALARGGLRPADAAETADWVVLNTCTVTAEADAEARRAIRRLRRRHPETRVVVTGCYAQRAPEELRDLPGVVCVVGRGGAASILGGLVPLAALAPAPAAAHAPAEDRTRPILQVQEGCGRRCSFCVVPFVRGDSRSLPLGEVLAQAQALEAAGALEVVISGINLGQWGRDRDARLGLPDLLRALLERTTLPRLRLSSVEPADWTPDLTALLASEARVARHVHLPLQSGSAAVLRRMRRRYTPAAYARRVLDLRRRAPLAAIGADVMVGFPDESESEFEETRSLVASLPFTYLHVFPFSPRPGTEAAARLASGEWREVPPELAAARARELRRLQAGKRAAHLLAMVGLRLDVITLHDTRAHGAWALSDNYLRVALPEAHAANRMVAVEITAAADGYLEARSLTA